VSRRGVKSGQNPRFGKPLGGEIYVASEASATPMHSYAPQSAIACRNPGSRPWTRGMQMLSTLGEGFWPAKVFGLQRFLLPECIESRH
jgi:hypothetical protein